MYVKLLQTAAMEAWETQVSLCTVQGDRELKPHWLDPLLSVKMCLSGALAAWETPPLMLRQLSAGGPSIFEQDRGEVVCALCWGTCQAPNLLGQAPGLWRMAP